MLAVTEAKSFPIDSWSNTMPTGYFGQVQHVRKKGHREDSFLSIYAYSPYFPVKW
jgi:hypothetical protein